MYNLIIRKFGQAGPVWWSNIVVRRDYEEILKDANCKKVYIDKNGVVLIVSGTINRHGTHVLQFETEEQAIIFKLKYI
jgi:hypothetical protein